MSEGLRRFKKIHNEGRKSGKGYCYGKHEADYPHMEMKWYCETLIRVIGKTVSTQHSRGHI